MSQEQETKKQISPLNVDELERLAMRGGDMPNGLNGPEQQLFLSFRYLYGIYRLGRISKDNAKTEKGKILTEFKQSNLNYLCWESGKARERKIQPLLQDVKNCECETCKKLIKAIQGL